MEIVTALLVIVHIVAMVAGGSNGVLNMLIGPRMAAATPDTRTVLYGMQDAAGQIGKISMVVLIVSGLLVLWLKWSFMPPNIFFWLKMLGLLGMLVFIFLAERETPASRSAGPQAGPAIAAKVLYGKLTSLCFLIVVLGAVLAFT